MSEPLSVDRRYFSYINYVHCEKESVPHDNDNINCLNIYLVCIFFTHLRSIFTLIIARPKLPIGAAVPTQLCWQFVHINSSPF